MSVKAAAAPARPLLPERPEPDDLESAERTLGHRVADIVTREIGSWRFLLAQGAVLVAWLVVNAAAWVSHWDPYPFILLNLILSFQAAFTAPIILISQNRKEEKDRLTAERDYRVDRLAEREVEAMGERLDDLAGRQWDALVEMQDRQIALLHQIEALTRELQIRADPPGATPPDPVTVQNLGCWFRPSTIHAARGGPLLEREMGWHRTSSPTGPRQRRLVRAPGRRPRARTGSRSHLCQATPRSTPPGTAALVIGPARVGHPEPGA